MAKCMIEFEYSIGDLVMDGGRRKWRIIRLSIDQYDKQWFCCISVDSGFPARMLGSDNLRSWTDEQGG